MLLRPPVHSLRATFSEHNLAIHKGSYSGTIRLLDGVWVGWGVPEVQEAFVTSAAATW